uniref:Uncharacterized protein n=1 Tax=Physcomitrium patens TaxID=3218 RepID=A0A2K1K9S8_PHYPA|nr:hypothetical protein PHYPA_009719 [Physcomitrium patens]
MAMGWDFVGALVQMERHHNAATISPTSNLGFKSTAIFRVFACFRCISVMVLQQLTIRHCRLQGINPATPCTLTGWVAFPPENAWIRIRQRRTAILTGVTELRSNDVHARKPFLGAPRNVPLPNVASVEIYRKRKLKAAQLGVTGSLGGVRGRAGGQSLCFCNLQNCMSSSSCAGLYPAAPLLGLHSPATNGRARGIRPQLLVNIRVSLLLSVQKQFFILPRVLNSSLTP